MRIFILAVGARAPAWVAAGVAVYTKRVKGGVDVVVREIPQAVHHAANDARAMKAECEKLLAAIPCGACVIALEREGRPCDSRALAGKIERWMLEGRDAAFLVGGSDGLAPECLNCADETLSLSRLTLPHQLVRVVLAEQLYRAWSIVRGLPYHRD